MDNEMNEEQEQEPAGKTLDELGYFENGVFHYHEPVTLPSGRIVQHIDPRGMVGPPGISVEDVLTAMANAIWDGTIERDSVPAGEDPDIIPRLMDGPVSPN
jgi:hypothetical protein